MQISSLIELCLHIEGDTSRRTSERLHKKMKPSYPPEQISFMGVPEDPRKSRQSPECAGVCEESEESDSFDSEVEEERKREREMEREKRDQEWKEAYSGTVQRLSGTMDCNLVTVFREHTGAEKEGRLFSGHRLGGRDDRGGTKDSNAEGLSFILLSASASTIR